MKFQTSLVSFVLSQTPGAVGEELSAWIADHSRDPGDISISNGKLQETDKPGGTA